MINNLILEFLKLKRDKLFYVMSAIALASPLFVMVLLDKESLGALNWERFLIESQVPIYFCMLLFMITVGASFFAKEYQLKTISSISCSGDPRLRIFAAKLIALPIIFFALSLLMALINLLLGTAVIGGLPDSRTFQSFLSVTFLTAPVYWALVPFVAGFAVLLKRSALTSIIYFGIIIFMFPFSGKSLIVPPILPVHLFIKIINKQGAPIISQFYNPNLNVKTSALTLALFFLIPLVLDFIYVRQENIKG